MASARMESGLKVVFRLKNISECRDTAALYSVRLFFDNESTFVYFENKDDYYVATARAPASMEKIVYTIAEEKGEVRPIAKGEHIVTKNQLNIGTIVIYDLIGSRDDSKPELIQWMKELISDEKNYQTTFQGRYEILYWAEKVLSTDCSSIDKVFSSAVISLSRFARKGNRISDMITLLGTTMSKWRPMKDSFELICDSLSLHDFNSHDQTKLYQQLWEDGETFKTPSAISVLQSLFKLAQYSFSPKWILLLPLYWIMAEKGHLPIRFRGPVVIKSPLPELSVGEGIYWEELKQRMANDIFQSGLKDIFEKVLKISEIHPWIRRPYLWFARGVTVCELIRVHGHEQHNFFDPLVTVTKLLECLSTKDSGITIEHFNEITTILDKFLDVIRTDRFERNSKEVVKFSISSIVSHLEQDKNWRNIAWGSDFAFRMLKVKPNLYEDIVRGLERIRIIVLEEVKKTEFAGVSQCIEVWNEILSWGWVEKDFHNRWRKSILQAIEVLLESKFKCNEEQFLDEYANIKRNVTPESELDKIIESTLYVCFKQFFQRSGMKREIPFLRNNAETMGKFFENFFVENAMGHSQSPEAMIQMILNWPHSLYFYRKYYRKLKKAEMPTVRGATGHFNKAMDDLRNGNVSFRIMRILVEKFDLALEIYLALPMRDETTQPSEMKEKYEERRREFSIIEKVISAHDNLKKTSSIFREAGHEFSELTDVNRILSDDQLDDKKLSALLCLTNLVDITKLVEQHSRDIELVAHNQKNVIFSHMWHSYISKRKFKCVEEGFAKLHTFGRHVSHAGKGLLQGHVRLNVVKFWINNSKSLAALKSDYGDFVTIHQTIQHQSISDTPHQKPEARRSRKSDQRKASEEAWGKIEAYHQLLECERAVKLLDDMKKTFAITGDYAELSQLQAMISSDDERLSAINEDIALLAAGIENCFLKKFETAHRLGRLPRREKNLLQLLEIYIGEKDFIYWLRNTLSDVKEVNAMCDLALTSDAKDITEKVNHFAKAVNGFAPLIFDIHNKEISYSDLLQRCWAVKVNGSENRDLGRDWVNAARNANIFKEREYHYGSAERRCHETSHALLTKGTYYISLRKARTHKRDEVICMTLPDENSDKGKTFTYSEIRELQSLLSLTTGTHGKTEDVREKFSRLLAVLEQLADTLINLVKEGCVLFGSCNVMIMPKPSENLLVEISLSDSTAPFGEECSIEDAEKLASVLSKTLTRWQRYVEKMRMKYYCLNEYSITQISYLCNQLAIHNNERTELQNQVYALLSTINGGVFEQTIYIRDLIAQSEQHDDEGMESELPQDDDPDEGSETADGEGSVRKKIALVASLAAETDLPEDLAKAAVQENGEDRDECLTWMLLNQHNTADEISTLAQLFDEETGYSTGAPDIVVNPMCFSLERGHKLEDLITAYKNAETSSMRMVQLVEELCKMFTSETSMTTLGDHLSIAHLGRFLQKIQEARTENDVIERQPPPLLRPGFPNLQICRNENIMDAVLSWYAVNPLQPLPSPTEILLCTGDTTAEEIKRFVRRAMCKPPTKDKRLFCLVRMDKLGHSEMRSMEKIFNKIEKSEQKDENYRLILMCSDPNNLLAVRFDKYRTRNPTATPKDLGNYLKSHLTTDKAKSAGMVDSENRIVRVVGSSSSGAGKSLYIERSKERTNLWSELPRVTTIRFLEKVADPRIAVRKLLPEKYSVCVQDPHFVHIDMTSAVQVGMEAFIFNLFVLGNIEGDGGRVWKRHPNHLYMVEITDKNLLELETFSLPLLNLLPLAITLQPSEILERKAEDKDFVGMDDLLFRTKTFQRPYQYLKRLSAGESLDQFICQRNEGSRFDCIHVLMQHCPVTRPTWAQLHNFAKFLDVQLEKCEKSVFCNRNVIRGLKSFATKLMIRMSKDFAVTSMDESEFALEGISSDTATPGSRWNNASHPYVFFNDDGQTMTFINVNVNASGDLLNDNGAAIEHSVGDIRLWNDLTAQGVQFGRNFDNKSRREKLEVLHLVMGIEKVSDPDEAYELTTDNVQKLIATYMQLQCKIPVIIMGETGCGKTRLVEFLSKLLRGKDIGRMYHFITKKIYGGISVADIQGYVKECLTKFQAKPAVEEGRVKKGTVLLFFDEVNTTEAVYAVKEIMCDLSCNGESYSSDHLQVVAACNPFKKLSENAIRRLGDSGLGRKVHVSPIDQTSGEKMSRLLYKVVPVPHSMMTFVRDFGELDASTERLYVSQMAKRIHNDTGINRELFTKVICAAQQYMRAQRNECRFVSLRDVERGMDVCRWFHKHGKVVRGLLKRNKRFRELRKKLSLKKGVWEILQSIGVCYYVSLDNRTPFLESISAVLHDLDLKWNKDDIANEIMACQKIFIKEANLKSNISRNQSLVENFFMMVICADLRIPLFVIGKPGSSKSLAKTTISGAMRGLFSESVLFRELKEVRLVSYQCSALSEAVGIKHLFDQCSELQEKNDPKSFSSVAVLDEIGLAEDSPSMPLKILHPLLEYGSIHQDSNRQRVGFFGISNWPLDPAKLNRGLFLLRGDPTPEDLLKTAMSIASGIDGNAQATRVLQALANTYIEMYRDQSDEFFGLRDFYSLIKAIKSDYGDLTKIWPAVLRNFNGSKTEVLGHFERALKAIFPTTPMPKITLREIIQRNLLEKDSRFLLLLTNSIPSESLLSMAVKDKESIEIIYGSSFPGDQNFAEVCRNIHRIKSCMETGKTVVLLNMAAVYESLYDALNQHYVAIGDKRYVDIGLGSHRVKCCISPNFRLIVLEQKDKAYERYPIPLLNRLEKHFLDARRLLDDAEMAMANNAEEWLNLLGTANFDKSDSIIGYHEDTVYSAVWFSTKSLENAKSTLLHSATLDSIYRIRKRPQEGQRELVLKYLDSKEHQNLLELLKIYLNKHTRGLHMLEIVSFSNILTLHDRSILKTELGLPSVTVVNLKEFRFERDLLGMMDKFLKGYLRVTKKNAPNAGAVLIIQCAQAQRNGELLECAKHAWANKCKSISASGPPLIVVILWSIERAKAGSFLLQNSSDYRLLYVDEVKPFDPDSIATSQITQENLPTIFSPNEADKIYIMRFLEVCFSKALVKIEGSRNAEERFYTRHEILSKLCRTNDQKSHKFRQILLKKIEQALSVKGTESWIDSEASNKESLQEGGTFYKTVLLKLTTAVANVIAHFVSVVDQYSNLNFLPSETPQIIEMWLNILDEIVIDWPGDITEKEFTAVPPRCPCPSMKCKVPFSFYITTVFEKQWQNRGKTDDLRLALRNHFLHRIFVKFRDECTTLLNHYISDLVNSRYLPGTEDMQDDEIQFVTKLIQNLTGEEWQSSVSDDRRTNGEQIAVAYAVFASKSTELGKLGEIFKACPTILRNVENWNLKDKDSPIHITALRNAIQELGSGMRDMNEKHPENCLKWMKNSNDIQQTIKDFETEEMQILEEWTPISLLNLFLLLMIPNDERKNEYIKLLIKPAKLLLAGSKRPAVDFARIVCNMLKKFYDDLKLKMLVDWGSDICRICRRKFTKPKRLKCGHFFCSACCRSVQANEGKCSICLNKSTASDIIDAFLTTEQSEELQGFKYNCTSFFEVFMKNVCFSRVLKDNEESKKDFIRLILRLAFGETAKTAPQLESSAIDLGLVTRASILREALKADTSTTTEEVNGYLKRHQTDSFKNTLRAISHVFESRHLGDSHPKIDLEGTFDSSRRALSCIDTKIPTLALLEEVAKIRSTIRILCRHINRGMKTDKSRPILRSFSLLNESCIKGGLGDFRTFLIKIGTCTYGMVWHKKLISSGSGEQAIPEELWSSYRQNPKMMVAEMMSFEMMGSMSRPYKEYLSETLTTLANEESTTRKISILVNLGTNRRISVSAEKTSLLELDRALLRIFEKCSSSYRGDLHSLLLLMGTVVAKKCYLMDLLASLVTSPKNTGTIMLENMFQVAPGDKVETEITVIRFILLSCLLIGFLGHPDDVKKMLRTSDITQELDVYFVDELLGDMERLVGLLAKDVGDTTLLLRKILHGVITESEIEGRPVHAWTTTTELNKWTQAFIELYIKPILQNADTQIASTRAHNDSLLLKSPLYRLSFECQEASQAVESVEVTVRETAVEYMKLCSLQDVTNSLRDDTRESMLKKILNTKHLGLVPRLESIFALQSTLIDIHQNLLSFEEAEEFEVKRYLRGEDMKKLAEIYISVWNNVFPTLRKLRETPVALSDLFQPISMESPVAMFLPSNTGKGRCAKLLTLYLVNIQNTLLDALRKCAVFCGSEIIREADIAQLRPSHYIDIDKQRDIVPLIQTHATYEINCTPHGKQHRITYNFDVLEKLVQENFLKNKKKIITKALPQVWYTRCNGIESEWNDVLQNHPQIDLTASTVQAIETMVTHSSSLYAALRALSDAISLLAVMGTRPEGSLKKFLAKDMNIPATDLSIIPPTAEIQHILALYSRLSWHRSVLYISRGLDPYKDIFPEGYQEEMKEQVVIKNVHDAFQCLNIRNFQQQLSQLIARVPDTPQNKSLAKDILPGFPFRFIEGSADTRLQMSLPEEICFKHAAWLFTQMVEYENGP